MTPLLGQLVQSFFTDYLSLQKGLRPSSIRSYRDTIRLFLCFISNQQRRPIAKLSIHDLAFDRVLAFLTHLEQERGNAVSTRNQRRAALNTFFSYLALREPEMLMACQRVAAIPVKRTSLPDQGRGAGVAKRLLDGFKGYLQTDGYDGYNAVVAGNQLIHVGCMAHARRRFSDAVKAQGKNKKRGKAHRGLTLIQKLYRAEKQARKMQPEKRYEHRQCYAKPILDEMKTWLENVLPQVPPTSVTGKALHYLHNEWHKLIGYLEDGRLEIDNNAAENAIRPFVVGRKNWLFSDSVKGVTASANLYSLIETAKANGLEPYAYLRYLFTELPRAETVDAIEALLPGKLDADQIKIQ